MTDDFYIDSILGTDSGSVDCGDISSQVKELGRQISKLNKQKNGTKKPKKLKKKIKRLKRERDYLQFALNTMYQGADARRQTHWTDVLCQSLPKALDLATAVLNHLPKGNPPLV